MRLLVSICLLGLAGVIGASAQASPESCPAFQPARMPFVRGTSNSPVLQSAIPYSMVRIRTTVQTLGNGTQITTRAETRIWRDADGRTRTQAREQRGELVLENISIYDPVLKQVTVLHERSQVAEIRRDVSSQSWQPRPVDKAFSAAVQHEYQTNTQSHVEFKQERLGTQMIIGECADGSRSTQIIPAGEIGNDSEIRVVNENWNSPRLGVSLRSMMDDPRTFHTVDEVIELHLEAPDPSVFQVPAGYQVFDLTRDPSNP